MRDDIRVVRVFRLVLVSKAANGLLLATVSDQHPPLLARLMPAHSAVARCLSLSILTLHWSTYALRVGDHVVCVFVKEVALCDDAVQDGKRVVRVRRVDLIC